MAKKEKKQEQGISGEILAIGGIVLSVAGIIIGIFLQDYMVIITTGVGGLIIVSLGLILLELESQTMLFIAYVEDFVRPQQKTAKTKKNKKN